MTRHLPKVPEAWLVVSKSGLKSVYLEKSLAIELATKVQGVAHPLVRATRAGDPRKVDTLRRADDEGQS